MANSLDDLYVRLAPVRYFQPHLPLNNEYSHFLCRDYHDYCAFPNHILVQHGNHAEHHALPRFDSHFPKPVQEARVSLLDLFDSFKRDFTHPRLLQIKTAGVVPFLVLVRLDRYCHVHGIPSRCDSVHLLCLQAFEQARNELRIENSTYKETH